MCLWGEAPQRDGRRWCAREEERNREIGGVGVLLRRGTMEWSRCLYMCMPWGGFGEIPFSKIEVQKAGQQDWTCILRPLCPVLRACYLDCFIACILWDQWRLVMAVLCIGNQLWRTSSDESAETHAVPVLCTRLDLQGWCFFFSFRKVQFISYHKKINNYVLGVPRLVLNQLSNINA